MSIKVLRLTTSYECTDWIFATLWTDLLTFVNKSYFGKV